MELGGVEPPFALVDTNRSAPYQHSPKVVIS